MRMRELTVILLVAGLVGCSGTRQLEEEIRQKDFQIRILEGKLNQALLLVSVPSGGDLSADDLDALIDQVEDLSLRRNSLTAEIAQLWTERDSLQEEIKKLQAWVDVVTNL